VLFEESTTDFCSKQDSDMHLRALADAPTPQEVWTTENARVENAARSPRRGWKMQEWSVLNAFY